MAMVVNESDVKQTKSFIIKQANIHFKTKWVTIYQHTIPTSIHKHEYNMRLAATIETDKEDFNYIHSLTNGTRCCRRHDSERGHR